MNIKNEFDTAIDVRFRNPLESSDLINSVSGRDPSQLRDVAVFITDSLDLAWVAARAVFEDKATPQLALEILDRYLEALAKMPPGSR
jgi:hypothetical protein